MAKKPARMFTRQRRMIYTRKEYIKIIPQPKIMIFEMGDLKNKDKYDTIISLYAMEEGRVTSNALEAARVMANKYLQENVIGGYFFKVYPYPHVILREHKMATGAGADRISRGMSLAFGKPIGCAAYISRGQKIMEVRVNKEYLNVAKEALRRAARKLPIPTTIQIEKTPS